MEAIANILDLYADVEEQDLNEIAVLRVPRIIPADRSDPMAYLNEDEFIMRYRLSNEAVRDLLREITPRLQRIRNNRGCSVPHQLQLLVALRYMASGNFQITMGDCGEMSTASVSKYIKIIAMAIARQASHHIHFPEPDEARSLGSQFYDIAGMPGVIGCIDGSHVKIISPGGDNAEVYRCRKGFMSLNVQGICDAQMKFINIVCSWPGSTHDARIFENSRIYTKLEGGQYSGHLLGDSGYGCSDFLMTPVLNPRTQKERNYNAAHVRTRNVIERAFGIWKRRFACLSIPLRTKLSTSKVIIMACAVLHNIAINRRIPIEDGFEHPLEQIGEYYHEGEGEEYNVAGGPHRRQALIERWF
ncbi:hypothetical protein Pcinc_028813 [Petrolisthes cinctipes]|uniref:Putative nuclease HARBI1 n=1 Tax=Petrolisthes cinctipes TaxID=88211 RepID=A0AAE1F246_PETCI|nr:hypothetical protein Pcinc_028813 [Petrolisthes cinctipes]